MWHVCLDTIFIFCKFVLDSSFFVLGLCRLRMKGWRTRIPFHFRNFLLDPSWLLSTKVWRDGAVGLLNHISHRPKPIDRCSCNVRPASQVHSLVSWALCREPDIKCRALLLPAREPRDRVSQAKRRGFFETRLATPPPSSLANSNRGPTILGLELGPTKETFNNLDRPPPYFSRSPLPPMSVCCNRVTRYVFSQANVHRVRCFILAQSFEPYDTIFLQFDGDYFIRRVSFNFLQCFIYLGFCAYVFFKKIFIKIVFLVRVL